MRDIAIGMARWFFGAQKLITAVIFGAFEEESELK
jgi:hypothetical protein